MFFRLIVQTSTPVLLAVALLLGSIQRGQAHADLLLQIEEATKLITANPKDPQLYLQRGELFRAHAEWEKAIEDYDRALALDAALPNVDFLKGRTLAEGAWPLNARAHFDRFLSRNPKHSEALSSRARVFATLKMNLAAAEDYTDAIRNTADPIPELYIERAQVLGAEGPEHYARAVQGLDEGLAKLGPLVTLQLYAMDLELKRKNYDGALTRVTSIAARSPRKETWHARRGEILLEANRPEEAREAFQAALNALNSLPPSRRNVPAMVQLEKRIREQMPRPGTPGTPTGTGTGIRP